MTKYIQCNTLYLLKFEWDEAKNIENYNKHGLWFEEAKGLWADYHAIEFFDPDHSGTEDRFIRTGRSTGQRTLVVVFSESEGEQVIRIISARRATRTEVLEYEEGI